MEIISIFFSMSLGMTWDLPGFLLIPIIFGILCYIKASLVLSWSLIVLGIILIPLGYNADLLALFIWPVAFWILVTGITSAIILLIKKSSDAYQPPNDTRSGPGLVGPRIKVFKGKEIIKETDGVSVDGKLYSGLLAAERAISASQSE